MKTISGALIALVGTGLLFLGLMFFIAAKSDSNRLIVAILLMAGGVLSLTIGVKLFLRVRLDSPEAIRKEMFKLAKKNHGFLSKEAISGHLGESDQVKAVLHSLISEGSIKANKEQYRQFYEFPDFYMKVMKKACPHCGNDYHLKDDLEACPNCGADLKIIKERVREEDEKFSL